MINRYKSKGGDTMIPLRFQTGGSNLFLTMPNGGNVGPMGASPMGLPQYGMGANYAFLKMQDGGDADMDGDDQSFYSNRMNTFIQKIRNNAEENLESAIMEQGQEPPMAQYGMNMNSDPMNSYDPGNLGAFSKTANYMKDLSKGAVSGYIQRMGALGPNNYYYKEKNIYRDKSKGAPLGTQLFTDADGNQSSISPEEAYNRANYALYSRQHGGGLPRAQKGIDWEGISNPDLLKRAVEMGHNSVEEYKNSGWGYGKNHWEYKAPPTYPSRVRINDPRTINATSGKPINANVDLKSGDYHTGVIGDIARAARAYGQSPQELIAIALQETNLGKADPNYGHVLDYHDPEDRGSAYDLAFAKTEKDKVAEGKGYENDELRKLQTYNGLGTVYPSTEAGYHGFNMSSIYGVPLTGAGINMVENPLYGKRIVDLRDNVLKNSQNAEYNQFLDKYNRDLANEEAVSQKQIAAYDLFNRINPEYGQQYATMLQNAYSDSLSNSSNSEYIYPEGDLDFGYSVPNLDNTRQRNALDRFNRAIGYQQIPFRDGGALKKYQGNDGASTTGDDYWTADELTYLKGLPKADRDKITGQGDKGREAYTTYRTANDKSFKAPVKTPTVNKTEATTTANNTVTGTGATGTTSTTGTTTGTATTTKPTGFENWQGADVKGWSLTTINGKQYPIDPSGQVIGYPYQNQQQVYNNPNPYGAYNPYAAYGSMRGRNLGTISKNRLTKDFRENMLAGSYGNPQLLGVSNIETRRAMDPGNRIKSMTFSYGQPIPSGRTTINQPAANNSASTPQTNTNTPVKSTPAATPNVSTLTPEQKIQQAMDFTFRPGQGPYNTTPDFPGLEKPKVGPWDPDADSWSNPSGYAYPTNNDSNIDPATDPRGANYGVEEYPEDLVLPEAGKVVQGSDGNYYVKLADGSIEKSIDREVLRRKTGFAKGGSLHRFMRGYQDGGPFSVREMSVGDIPEMVDQIVEPESNNTPMEFKPYEMTDADRVRAVDVGTEYEQLEPGDGMAPAFDVETKRRKKRIGNPEKDLAFINMATGLLRGRDATYAERELRSRSQASQVFNPMRSMEGNYDILSGDFRRGKRAADGNDAFHSGFSTYAQMGGSMLENLKEGDEVYLTEEQINEILKRGGKLSYL